MEPFVGGLMELTVLVSCDGSSSGTDAVFGVSFSGSCSG